MQSCLDEVSVKQRQRSKCNQPLQPQEASVSSKSCSSTLVDSRILVLWTRMASAVEPLSSYVL